MIYIVTGVSRGLGYAIVDALLKRNKEVICIGRTNPFGDKVVFHQCDLSDAKQVESIDFNFASNAAVTLINNAAIIGEIGRISSRKTSDIEQVMQVNLFAPMMITQNAYSRLENKSSFTLVNISSGAANRSIPSWASYCASKAALNRVTENFYKEELELGNHVKVYAVAPGVIDTGMQAQIRSASKETFSEVENFIRMKEDGILFSPEEAATRLFTLLSLDFNGDVFYDLRMIEQINQ